MPHPIDRSNGLFFYASFNHMKGGGFFYAAGTRGQRSVARCGTPFFA
jgi:hypothetical protein